MRRRLALLFASALGLGLHANAQTLLKNVAVVNVETGTITHNQSILIDDERIVQIGSNLQSQASQTTQIDMQGAFVLPGLSDSHVHLTSGANIHGYRRLAVSVPDATITGVVNAEKTLEAGFTTVRNLGAPGYADIALMNAIGQGKVAGPRMLASGPSIGITGGHCDNNLLPFQYGITADGVADGPWAVRQKVRQHVKYGATVIKFCGTGGVLSKGTKIGAQQFTLEEMSALVDEAHMLGLKVAVHAHGTDGITTALAAGVDSVEHSSLISDESIEAAIKAGAYLSMDVYVSDYILAEGEAAGILPESLEKERQVGRLQRERFRAAHTAGAKIAYGTDAGVYPHGLNARQFSKMVQWGMSPLQAIQAATINNAHLFGMDADIGTVEPGKYADLIATRGNPLIDVTELESVDFVMKAGQVHVNRLAQ